MTSVSKQPPVLYRIVVGHYLFSAICLVALAFMLLVAARDLLGHYFHPHLLAITHAAALGWATMIIFGACYQLIPVVFETELYSYRLPWLSFLLFGAGLILLITAFWLFEPGLIMQTAAVLVLSGIAVFSLIVMRTANKAGKSASIYREFIITSSIWLFFTALLGACLVFNFRYPFLPKDHLHFLKLHAHMGIAGWFLLLIIGVSSKLIPMFLVSRNQNEKLLEWSYYLINAALLLFLLDGWFNGINAKTAFIAAIAIGGIGTYAAYIYGCFKSRLKKKIELPITNTIISYVLLGSAIITLPFIIYLNLKGNSNAVHLSTLYGALLLVGWITSLILGQTFKTLPFIAWSRKYEHLAGKIKTPLPADLYKNSLLRVQTIAYAVFCASFFPGLLLKFEGMIYGGLICLLIAAITYLTNTLIVIFHKANL